MARRYLVEFTTSASRDVRIVHDIIARDRPRTAAGWLRDLHRQIRRLQTQPLKFEIIPEGEELGIPFRHTLCGNYRLIYQVLEDRVVIIRIVHAARLLERGMFGLPPLS